MFYASHENCRELYELSGWQTGTFIYYRADGHRIEQLVGKPHADWVPAYDLDFLKGKVPVGDGDDADFAAEYCVELIRQDILRPATE